jgi:hypothetical protein
MVVTHLITTAVKLGKLGNVCPRGKCPTLAADHNRSQLLVCSKLLKDIG